MNLLGSASYDPSVAVSKATSSLLAMTAIDTTNLRLAITVPAHGKVKFRMSCTIVGATTLPGILLGVLNGATVLKRMAPQMFSGTQDRATEMATAIAEFTVTGLTPGALSADAAYAVQVIVASTNIKYGGPNDTTGADAWGAFVFEAWDPQPMPLAIAPGAAGGLLIAGANAATTFATLTSTGAFSINGANQVSQTGDSFARLGAPAGASVSADIAAVKAAELTAAQIATGVWTDTTAGDFTAALSIGKSVMNGVALGTGLTINGYTGNTPQTGDSFVRLGAPTGASVSADVAAVKTDTAAIKTQTDKFAFTVANQVDANVLDWKSATAPAMTGDSFARLGAPAGASVSADIAAVKAAELTAAQIATGVWTDTTAGDFTAALSIGKSVMNGVALGTGLTINGYTGNTPQTGDSFVRLGAAGAGLTALGDARFANLDAAVSSRSTYAGGAVASVTAAVTVGTNNDKAGYALSSAGVQAIWDALTSALTTVGSIGKLLVSNIDAAISSRMATFTQPSGFLAATFPSTVASPSNITSGTITTVTNLTNAPTAGDFTATMKTSLNAATPAVTVSDKTGFSLSQSFPANFSALGISVGGHISNVDTLTTYTGNTLQTGDSFARIGLAGVGLTNVGDARLAHLDADVSSRLATSGYTAPDNADITSIKTTIGVAGAGLTAIGDTRLAHLDADVSSRLATSGYTAPDNADITLIKTALGVAGAGLTALGDARLAHLDADVSSRLATSGYTAPPSATTIAGDVWDVVISGHLTSGTTGAALNGAGAAGDPWTTTLPGTYGLGTAGNIIGNTLDALISSRLATSGYTAPDNTDITSIKATIGVAGAGLTALGDARLAHLDADVSSRLATSGYTAPDNVDITSIKTTIGVAGAGLTALGDARLAHLDADVSSRLATSGYTAPDNADIAAILFAVAALNNLSAAGVRAAVGLASANLDTQLGSLPTNAALATALAGADDATLAAIAALSVPTAAAIANEVATRTLKANITEVNSVSVVGDGAATPWGPA